MKVHDMAKVMYLVIATDPAWEQGVERLQFLCKKVYNKELL